MFNRIIFLLAVIAVSLSLLAVNACASPAGDTMNDKYGIPDIDKNVPALVETATFALG